MFSPLWLTVTLGRKGSVMLAGCNIDSEENKWCRTLNPALLLAAHFVVLGAGRLTTVYITLTFFPPKPNC